MNDPLAKLVQSISHVTNRSVEEVFPSKGFLEKQIQEKKKLRVYTGIDPTGNSLHIGHAIVLKKLKEFQDLGHETIMLIGDFTAMIGDPTDKAAVRKTLTEKEIKHNLKAYKKQASKLLRFTGKNATKIMFNSKWLRKLDMKDVLELTALMTVDQMMKRDMFAKRGAEGKPVFIHEFMYPLLQGYDSVAMDVDVEIGGNDQMFNMLVGRDFLKKLKNKEKIAITMKLLTDSSGKKMGKTEGNMVSLADSAVDMYGKIMSWTDGMILPGFELCTFISETELESIKIELARPETNPKNLKSRLAFEIVTIYHGETKAHEAAEYFSKAFGNKEMPENIEIFKVKKGDKLSAALVEHKILSSIGDFKRLVSEKAIKIDGMTEITDFNQLINSDMTLKVGKRTFITFKAE
jgi:tyrosyl-tRNA synthetase